MGDVNGDGYDDLIVAASLLAQKGDTMLVITRKLRETVRIGEDITIAIIEINRDNVRLGITAPKEVRINREDHPLPSRQEDKS